MFDFSGRVVIVTGAAGSLGSAIARAFQSAGAKLTLVDRADGRLQKIYHEMADSPDFFFVNSIDLTKADDIQAMVDGTLDHFGQVDVLVSHALLDDDAKQQLIRAGAGNIWSTDSVTHDSNVIPLRELLKDAVLSLG